MTPTTRLKIDADPDKLAEEGPSRGKTTQGSGKNEKAAQWRKKRGGRGEQVKSKTEGIEGPLAVKTIDGITPSENL